MQLYGTLTFINGEMNITQLISDRIYWIALGCMRQQSSLTGAAVCIHSWLPHSLVAIINRAAAATTPKPYPKLHNPAISASNEAAQC